MKWGAHVIREPDIQGWKEFITEMNLNIKDALDAATPVVIHAPSSTGTGGSRILRHLYEEYAVPASWPPLNRLMEEPEALEQERRKIRPSRQSNVTTESVIWFPVVVAPDQPTTTALLDSLDWLRDVYSIESPLGNVVKSTVTQASRTVLKKVVPGNVQTLNSILQFSVGVGRAVTNRRTVGADILGRASSLTDEIADLIRDIAEIATVVLAIDGSSVDKTITSFLRRLMMRGLRNRPRRLVVVVTLPDTLGLLNEIPRRIEMRIPALDHASATRVAQSLNPGFAALPPEFEGREIIPLEVVHHVLFPNMSPVDVYLSVMREVGSEYPVDVYRVADVLSRDEATRQLIQGLWTPVQQMQFEQGLQRLGWLLDRNESGTWELRASKAIHEACARACASLSRALSVEPVDTSAALLLTPTSVTDVAALLGVLVHASDDYRYVALTHVLEGLSSIDDPAFCEELANFDADGDQWKIFVQSLLRAESLEIRGAYSDATRLRSENVSFLETVSINEKCFKLVIHLARNFLDKVSFNPAIVSSLVSLWSFRDKLTDEENASLRRRLKHALSIAGLAHTRVVSEAEIARILGEIELEFTSYSGRVDKSNMGPEARLEVESTSSELDIERLKELVELEIKQRVTVEISTPEVFAEVAADIDRCLKDDTGWGDAFDGWRVRMVEAREGSLEGEIEDLAECGIRILAACMRIREVTSLGPAVADWRRIPEPARSSASSLHTMLNSFYNDGFPVEKLRITVRLVLSAIPAGIKGDSYSFKKLSVAVNEYVTQDSRDSRGLAVSAVRFMVCVGREDGAGKRVLVSWFKAVNEDVKAFGRVSAGLRLDTLVQSLVSEPVMGSQLLTARSVSELARKYCPDCLVLGSLQMNRVKGHH